MPVYEQSQVGLRCPVCFEREIDVVLLRDAEGFYCVKCSYTAADEEEVREGYQRLRAKYRWLRKRVTLDDCR